jgi:L-2-hydroxyglutarate oxidase
MYDYVIIGGGIIGLSTAWQLKKKLPDKRILLLEKESEVAFHQTGHNSGVIHAGVYYQPDSLKARFCREGHAATIQFCEENDIPFEQCGKVLVATNEIEFERMQALHQRCMDNNVEVEWLDAEQLQQLEPNIQGMGAILVPNTGIVNYSEICRKMAQHFQSSGGEILLDSEVQDLNEDSEKIRIITNSDKNATGEVYETCFMISCAGLMSDRLTRMLDIEIDFQIIPFRGEYYQLSPRLNKVVKHLIYPIPDPAYPFLGVHLTRMINGTVTVGPNAVLGWKREGYGLLNFSLKDTKEMLSFSGFWKLMRQHIQSGIAETRDSWWKPGYLHQVRKYCADVSLNDLRPYPAGIRAQAVDSDGKLIDDFLFVETPRSLHVCNAPSPAATSAIPIGSHIVEKLLSKPV